MNIPWWGWVVFAGVLALAELHVPGSYLVWIALGAALTGAVDAAFGVSLEGQLATFAVASALSCILGYFVYRRVRGEVPLNERSLAMVGTRGTVCEAFFNGHGKVRLGDGVWLADGSDLAQGTPVVVSAVRGTRLVVQAVEPRAGSSIADAARAS
jgi:membrane protein implicated in regulation of membrane protease activity